MKEKTDPAVYEIFEKMEGLLFIYSYFIRAHNENILKY